MTRQDEHKFAVFMAWLGTVFSKDGGATKDKIDVYFDFLKDLDIGVLEIGVKKIILKRVYPGFPTVAEIREAALGNDAEAEDEALAAWGEAVRLISGGQRSTDEKVNEAIRLAFGSWDRFGQTDPEMEAADRAHFIRCFRQINRRQRMPRLREGESLTKAIAEIGGNKG